MTTTETIAAILAAHLYRESTAGRAAHCSCGTWLLGAASLTHRAHVAAAIVEALGSSDDGLRARVEALAEEWEALHRGHIEAAVAEASEGVAALQFAAGSARKLCADALRAAITGATS